MPSQRQTLSEYLKRQQSLRNSRKRYPISDQSLDGKRCLQRLIEAKKNNVSTLMTDFLFALRDTVPKQNNQLGKLEEMIRYAVQQINDDFDEVGKCLKNQTQNETKSKTSLQREYIITLNSEIYEGPEEKSEPNVLKEVKSNRKRSNRKNEKQLKFTKENDLKSETSKLKSILLKERPNKMKENSQNFSFSMKNPEDDFEYSTTEDILNKAFDQKQEEVVERLRIVSKGN